MSDTSDQNQTPAQLREYADRQKERADAAEAQIAEGDKARRENAFLRAGVDLDSPLGTLFSKGYEGELDGDKVKEAWSALQPAQAPPPEAASDAPTPEELAQAQARDALNTGGVPPGEEPSPSPWDAAKENYKIAKEKGQSTDRAQTAAIQTVMDAAVAGDERVLYDRDRWKAQFEG